MISLGPCKHRALPPSPVTKSSCLPVARGVCCAPRPRSRRHGFWFPGAFRTGPWAKKKSRSERHKTFGGGRRSGRSHGLGQRPHHRLRAIQLRVYHLDQSIQPKVFPLEDDLLRQRPARKARRTGRRLAWATEAPNL